MRTVKVTLTGTTPMLHHQDNIEWADRMKAWETDPKNRGKSKAGDDRTPPFRWVGSLYHDGKHVVIPSDNVMSALMAGGARVLTGNGKKTFKAQTQSGLLAPDIHWRFLCRGESVPVSDVLREMEALTWEAHNVHVAKLGFMLFVKRARVGTSKHIRVRPRFDDWRVEGLLKVTDDAITLPILQQIGEQAGQHAGLGDWRPGGKTPGPWGMFTFSCE